MAAFPRYWRYRNAVTGRTATCRNPGSATTRGEWTISLLRRPRLARPAGRRYGGGVRAAGV